MEKLSLCECVRTLPILETVIFFRHYHILLWGRVNFDCVFMQNIQDFWKVSRVVTNGLSGNTSLKACSLARGFEGFDKSTIHEEIYQLYYILTRICLFLCNSKLRVKFNYYCQKIVAHLSFISCVVMFYGCTPWGTYKFLTILFYFSSQSYMQSFH